MAHVFPEKNQGTFAWPVEWLCLCIYFRSIHLKRQEFLTRFQILGMPRLGECREIPHEALPAGNEARPRVPQPPGPGPWAAPSHLPLSDGPPHPPPHQAQPAVHTPPVLVGDVTGHTQGTAQALGQKQVGVSTLGQQLLHNLYTDSLSAPPGPSLHWRKPWSEATAALSIVVAKLRLTEAPHPRHSPWLPPTGSTLPAPRTTGVGTWCSLGGLPFCPGAWPAPCLHTGPVSPSSLGTFCLCPGAPGS